jgi:hypothetical protein
MLQSFSFHLVNVARVSGTVIDSMLMVIARFMRAVTLLGLTAVARRGSCGDWRIRHFHHLLKSLGASTGIPQVELLG